MARMYSRKKGKSGSKRPVVKTVPKWVSMTSKEVEDTIETLSKKGTSSSQIGLILRDQYGIPSVKSLTGKRITAVKKEKKVATELPEDLLALIKKLVNEREHIARNKMDLSAAYGMQITEAKIRKLANYYKREGRLSQNWAFDYGTAKLLVE